MEFAAWILVLVLLVRWFMLHSKLKELEQQIADLSERLVTQAQVSDLTRRVWTLEQGVVVSQMPPPMAPPPPVTVESPVESLVQEHEPPRFQTPQPSWTEKLREASGGGEWEALIGGNILNKLGALILVVGIALFLGYSFGHMTPGGRAAIAIAVSLLLLGVGVWVERRGRYRMFSRGLIGAGWAALYATAYAIYALPEARIIGNPFVGSIVMLAVAMGMVLHSLKYRSQALTAVAYFAAFAALAVTPNSPFAVVSLIPLAGSVLYLAARFEWYALPLFGLAATYLTCMSRGNSNASLASTQSLFLVYWLMFEGFDLVRVKRRLAGGGMEWLFPMNALAFVGLSSLGWSRHAPHELWLASAGAACLFLADSVVRGYLRGPLTFSPEEGVAERLIAGSFEGPLLVSAVLAGLTIVDRLTGIWAATGLAVEAEILYLAGLGLKSDFVRRMGAVGLFVSLAALYAYSWDRAKVVVLGHRSWSWMPGAIFHAALFYVNRAIRRPNILFSSVAAALVAVVLASELPEVWVGMAWLLFSAVLLEIWLWRKEIEFRTQAYVLFAAGVAAVCIAGLWATGDARTALAVSLAVAYAMAWRSQWFAGMVAALGPLSTLLIWRAAPHEYAGLAWIAVTLVMLEHASRLASVAFRFTGIGVAVLAFVGTMLRADRPGEIWISCGVVAGFYVAQWMMKRGHVELEQMLFSILGSLLLAIVLFGKVSGGLLTVAWGLQGVALLAAGFPLNERALRLQGLVLLLFCILKLFLFDLRNLETVYRILSFVALGVILLAVSWVYTRYREHLKRLL